MVDLKKCPFCGGRAVIVAGEEGVNVECLRCGIGTRKVKDSVVMRMWGEESCAEWAINRVVEAWNKREE